MKPKELIQIEEIEFYYLNVISKYISADIFGLINMLESHNKTWDYWYPRMPEKGSFFDTGSERVIYMLLNRGDILGMPNANPIGSDNSFLKYDNHFGRYLAINLDVKSIKANSSIGDILGNIPIGINQNCYDCSIEYKDEIRHYTPGLETSYNIKDHHGNEHNYLTLSYEVVILYEQNPFGLEPKSEKVIGIFVACIPNGNLSSEYGNGVFNPGKSGKLKICSDQIIRLPKNKQFKTDKGYTLESILKKFKLSKKNYTLLNGPNDIRWDVDARFDYIRNNFKCLDNTKKRIMKLFLEEDRIDYHIHNRYDKKTKKIINKMPQKVTKDAAIFLKDLNIV
jgi:hypothetical protein